jgi:hypothetical protein
MKPFKFFQSNNIMWTNAAGVSVSINRLGENHIYNIIRCLVGRGGRIIPEVYQGKTRQEWLTIMNDELDRRRNEGV